MTQDNWFGQKLAQLRKQKDWTQEYLANLVGVHVRHVSRWETGRNLPHPSMRQQLAKIFEISADEFVPPPQNADVEELLQDQELLEEIRLLRELDAHDRATVRQVIKAFATKKRMAQLISA